MNSPERCCITVTGYQSALAAAPKAFREFLARRKRKRNANVCTFSDVTKFVHASAATLAKLRVPISDFIFPRPQKLRSTIDDTALGMTGYPNLLSRLTAASTLVRCSTPLELTIR